ncbi:hypothetical protein DL96DRAFT_1561500 [Flagelloscypha sp. PMI_526]|nr:hypothetical protein DL96DRAFT_1561500 [Flagelloscypha sp. PMI_526]
MAGTPTATLTTTATSANLTVVALHTLDVNHASVSISWNADKFTTYLDHYVVGETDAAGKFRADRPIETWSSHAFVHKFFEPGATGSLDDRLACTNQVYATLQPRPTTTLGYAVQECADVHVNPKNNFLTTTGYTTITPLPVKTVQHVAVITTTLYKDNLQEAAKVISSIVRTRIIIGVVVGVVVALLGALGAYLKKRNG